MLCMVPDPWVRCQPAHLPLPPAARDLDPRYCSQCSRTAKTETGPRSRLNAGSPTSS
jgi:hypothetical protein